MRQITPRHGTPTALFLQSNAGHGEFAEMAKLDSWTLSDFEDVLGSGMSRFTTTESVPERDIHYPYNKAPSRRL